LTRNPGGRGKTEKTREPPSKKRNICLAESVKGDRKIFNEPKGGEPRKKKARRLIEKIYGKPKKAEVGSDAKNGSKHHPERKIGAGELEK